MVRIDKSNEPKNKMKKKNGEIFTFALFTSQFRHSVLGTAVTVQFYVSNVIPTQNRWKKNMFLKWEKRKRRRNLRIYFDWHYCIASKCAGWSRKNGKRLHLNVNLFLYTPKTDWAKQFGTHWIGGTEWQRTVTNGSRLLFDTARGDAHSQCIYHRWPISACVQNTLRHSHTVQLWCKWAADSEWANEHYYRFSHFAFVFIRVLGHGFYCLQSDRNSLSSNDEAQVIQQKQYSNNDSKSQKICGISRMKWIDSGWEIERAILRRHYFSYVSRPLFCCSFYSKLECAKLFKMFDA